MSLSPMIREARYGDIKQIRALFDLASEAHLDKRSTSRLDRLHPFYPLLKVVALVPNFHQHALNIHIYEENKRILGAIQTSCRDRNAHRWHIDNLAALPDILQAPKITHDLLDFVFCRYGELYPVERFTLEVDQKQKSLIRLYESHGFRPYTSVSYFRLPMIPSDRLPDHPIPIEGLRARRANDAQALFELYTAAMPVTIRQAEGRSPADFSDDPLGFLSTMLKDLLKHSHQRRWVVERNGTLVASLETIAQFKRLPHIVRIMVHPGYEDLYHPLLMTALQALAPSPPLPVLVACVEHQEMKRQILQQAGFKLALTDQLMVKDNLRRLIVPTGEMLTTRLEDKAFKPAFAEFQECHREKLTTV